MGERVGARPPPGLRVADELRVVPRVRSHRRVRKRSTEYVRESAIKWMSGNAKRHATMGRRCHFALSSAAIDRHSSGNCMAIFLSLLSCPAEVAAAPREGRTRRPSTRTASTTTSCRAAAPPGRQTRSAAARPPRVRTHSRFTNRGTEYVSKFGIKRAVVRSGSAAEPLPHPAREHPLADPQRQVRRARGAWGPVASPLQKQRHRIC